MIDVILKNQLISFWNHVKIRSILDKYRDTSSIKSECIGYASSVPYIKELYNISRFRELLFEVRMDGNLKELETYFDGLLYGGAYDDLLVSTDKFYFCSDDVNMKQGAEKVKELVKLYKVKFNNCLEMIF